MPKTLSSYALLHVVVTLGEKQQNIQDRHPVSGLNIMRRSKPCPFTVCITQRIRFVALQKTGSAVWVWDRSCIFKRTIATILHPTALCTLTVSHLIYVEDIVTVALAGRHRWIAPRSVSGTPLTKLGDPLLPERYGAGHKSVASTSVWQDG